MPANPYVGPRPLGFNDPIFGRDREISELRHLVSAERIVLLHSPSGAGKSSLVNAGLIPQMLDRFDVWVPTRVNSQPPTDSRIGNRYVWSAAVGFEQELPEDRRRAPEHFAAASLKQYVQERPRRSDAPPDVLLIFDQFEEILRVDPQDVSGKREFFRQLGELLMDPSVWALFVLREDYLAPLDPYIRLVPTYLRNRYRLDVLGTLEAKEAIGETAKAGGRNFTPAALDRLVRDLASVQVQNPDGTFAPQLGEYVEPLQLQVACFRLWSELPAEPKTIDEKQVEEYGKVTEALSGYYADSVKKVAQENEAREREIREWVGGKLIQDGVRNQVRRGAGKSDGLDNDVIDGPNGLVDSHLVRKEQRAGSYWFELAHDRLMGPVLASNAKWFEDHLHKVQKIAIAWHADGKPADRLLGGDELKEAQRWAEAQPVLTEMEQSFLAASAEAQTVAEEKNQQARRINMLSMVVLLVLSLEAEGLGVVFALLAGIVAGREWKARRLRVEPGRLEYTGLKFERRVAVTLAGIVVALVMVAFARHVATNNELKYKFLADRASSESQNKNSMKRLSALTSETLTSAEPGKSDLYGKKAERFTEQLTDLQKEARASEAALTLATRTASRFHIGQVVLEIAAFLAALSIVIKRKQIWVGSIVCAVAGVSFVAWVWLGLR